MFGATTLILVSYLLPAAQSIYFADLSLVIFLFANFRVELMILEDLRRARALQKNFDLFYLLDLVLDSLLLVRIMRFHL